MNLQTTETTQQVPPVVQTPADQQVMSNYPRSGFTNRQPNNQQSVFRQSLTVIRKQPLVFIALATASVFFTFLSMEMQQALPRLNPSILSRLVVGLVISLVTFVIVRVIQYHLSSTAMTVAMQSETEEFRSVAKSSQAWGAVLALTFVSGLATFASSIAIRVLSSTLNLPLLLSTWSGVITIPLVSLVTCRFIFAPLIAATGKTGAIDAMRESIVLTGGMGLKAFGWTALVATTSFGAQWLMRVDTSVIGHVAFLIPLFMYVVLGVWYARVAKTLAD